MNMSFTISVKPSISFGMKAAKWLTSIHILKEEESM